MSGRRVQKDMSSLGKREGAAAGEGNMREM